MLDFSKPNAEGIAEIAANLRRLDVIELEATGYTDMEYALSNSVAKSTFSYLVYDSYGRPLGAFGCGPLGTLSSGRGSPWFVGTDFLDKHRVAMVRYGKRYVQEFSKAYPVMLNMVHHENTPSIRWLKHIGFKLNPPTPAGVRGELFHVFHMGVA